MGSFLTKFREKGKAEVQLRRTPHRRSSHRRPIAPVRSAQELPYGGAHPEGIYGEGEIMPEGSRSAFGMLIGVGLGLLRMSITNQRVEKRLAQGRCSRLRHLKAVRSVRIGVSCGHRRAAPWASLLGPRSPKVSSRLMFCPVAIISASMLTFSRVLIRNRRIPCQSLPSANSGSIDTLRFLIAFW